MKQVVQEFITNVMGLYGIYTDTNLIRTVYDASRKPLNIGDTKYLIALCYLLFFFIAPFCINMSALIKLSVLYGRYDPRT